MSLHAAHPLQECRAEERLNEREREQMPNETVGIKIIGYGLLMNVLERKALIK